MTTREIVDEATAIAGIKRHRVLSLVDRLYRDGAIDFAQHSAAGILRDVLMTEMPASQGVSSYGGNVSHADPATKADRVGRRLTGYAIDFDGQFSWLGGRKPLGNQRRLEDAIFAAVGVYDDAGERHISPQHADLLLRAVTCTEEMPSLTEIAHQLTTYYDAHSKRPPAFALGVMCTWLSRLALHYRLAK